MACLASVMRDVKGSTGESKEARCATPEIDYDSDECPDYDAEAIMKTLSDVKEDIIWIRRSINQLNLSLTECSKSSGSGCPSVERVPRARGTKLSSRPTLSGISTPVSMPKGVLSGEPSTPSTGSMEAKSKFVSLHRPTRIQGRQL